ncbi:MAG: T9SS type A sorting domain-containing protein [Candidatus Cloacimonetes bacterium]|nr:T9SS type A sorting domain-containing protein [Candidatus Cloacimonadota bacterium]
MKKFLILLIIFTISSSLIYAHPSTFNQIKNYGYSEVRADSIIGFEVLHYDIYMELNTDESSIDYGYVVSTIIPDNSLSEITYELVGLTVDSVFVNNSINSFTHQNGEITIPLNSLSDEFTTRVVYHGNPILTTDGYTNGMRFLSNQVFTVSCPNAARYWFPCYDHPWQKVFTDVKVRIRSDWMVASNGIRQSITNHNDGTSTTHWKNEEPIVTYLISVAAADYVEQYSEHNGLPLQNFVFPNQAEPAEQAFEVIAPAIDIYSELYGEYPFSKYGNAVASISNFAAMEHQTITTIGSSYVNTNFNSEMVIVHELSHSWFGNSLTALTWKDVWLSEGFATYSEALFIENYYNFAQSRDYIRTSYHNYYKNFTQNYGYKKIYDPVYNEFFYPMVYQKAASVLNMLRLKLGNETYFNLIQQWFALGHRNVITSEFIELAEQVSQQDLTQFFSQWIFGTGYPDITYNTLYNSETNSIVFYAKTVSPTETDFTIDIPVIIKDMQDTVLDSVVIQANPDGGWTSYQPTFDNNLNQVQILYDQNNWNLANYNTNEIQLNFEAFAGNNQIILAWDDNENYDFVGYNIYKIENNQVTKLNETLITHTFFTDNNVTPNYTYTYILKPVFENNYELFNSFELEVTSSPQEASNSGILLVNETNHGNGNVINPSNEQILDFYNYTLSEIDFDIWDVQDNGLPQYEDLISYAHILWIDDDFQTTLLDNTYQTQHLAKYLLCGGQAFISGFRTSQSLSSNFVKVFTNLQNTTNIINISNSVLLKATSNIYNDLDVNFDKIPESWIYGLVGATYYEPIENNNFENIYSVYTENENFAELNNKICAIQNEQLSLIGFPLYYFNTEQVKTFLTALLADCNPNDDIITINDITTLDYNIYPNPFTYNQNKSQKINIMLKNNKNQNVKLDIYNIKGQKIKTLYDNFLTKGNHKIQINSDFQRQNLSSGIYLLKLCTPNDDNNTIFKKFTIIK